MGLILLMVAALAIPAVASAEQSLCTKDESALLSCRIGKKIMSLCRQQGGAPKLVYRYGSVKKVELAYPADLKNSRNMFYRGSLPLYGGGMDYVGFLSGEYEYRIYSKVARSNSATEEDRVPVFEDGILIYRSGKLIKQLICDDGGEGFHDSIEWLPLK